MGHHDGLSVRKRSNINGLLLLLARSRKYYRRGTNRERKSSSSMSKGSKGSESLSVSASVKEGSAPIRPKMAKTLGCDPAATRGGYVIEIFLKREKKIKSDRGTEKKTTVPCTIRKRRLTKKEKEWGKGVK